MFFIFWLLSGNTLVSSFKSDVIPKIIDESGNDKFIFTKINTRVFSPTNILLLFKFLLIYYVVRLLFFC